VTHLRKIMLEELQRRNFAQTTIKSYIHAVEGFAEHFGKPPDQLNLQHLREYQAYLLRKRKLEPRTVKLHVSALRFFFVKTLTRRYLLEDIPYPKVPRQLPIILHVEEVARLINSARNLRDRTLLMVLYATGSNHRSLSFQDGKVSFRWRDYAHGSKNRTMTLSANEFLRRFLLHVLPKGFVRIPFFGSSPTSAEPHSCPFADNYSWLSRHHLLPAQLHHRSHLLALVQSVVGPGSSSRGLRQSRWLFEQFTCGVLWILPERERVSNTTLAPGMQRRGVPEYCKSHRVGSLNHRPPRPLPAHNDPWRSFPSPLPKSRPKTWTAENTETPYQ
jgi:hypothetical protein